MEGRVRRLASVFEETLLGRRFGNTHDARRIGFNDSGRLTSRENNSGALRETVSPRKSPKLACRILVT